MSIYAVYHALSCSGTYDYGKTRVNFTKKTCRLILDEIKNKYRALDDWFKTPQGHDIKRVWVERISPLVTDIKGGHCLQLGSCDQRNPLGLFARKKWIVSPCLDLSSTDIFASPLQLPLQRNSMDLIIAPFAMEIFGGHRAILHEIDRVLKPMGHILLLGVNPVSIWGMMVYLGFLQSFWYTKGTAVSSLFLKQHLLNLGYEHKFLETFYDLPPLNHADWIKRLGFVNEMSKMISLMPSGFYCLMMQKRQYVGPNFLGKVQKQALTLAASPIC